MNSSVHSGREVVLSLNSNMKIRLKQYGYKNFIIRLLKYALRKVGITFEKFVVLKINLDKKLIPIEPKIKIDVKELDLQDLENARHFNFSKHKLNFFRKRLGGTGYTALGAFNKDELIYFCWLSLDIFESSVSLDDKIALDKDEALLLDAFTHPNHRGPGILKSEI